MVVGIAGDHLRQGELGDVLVVHGHANEAFGVGCHEVDVLGGGELRRANEVAFAFALGVVGTHDEAAGAQLIGEEFALVSGYALRDPAFQASFAGYKDWFLQEFNRPAYTVEVGLGVNPLPITDFPSIYAKNLGILALGLER